MKKKINVLQVIPKLGYGGAETGCYDLAHFLHEKGVKSFIATSGGELLKFVDRSKVKVFKLPVHSKNPALILFNSILGMKFDEHNTNLKSSLQRQELLNMILLYFKLHLQGFKTPKSIVILNQVFN